MVKRCQWGLCNTDDRYPERLLGGVKFIPFPKPRRNREKCMRWIKLCGRPHYQLNVDIVDGNRHLYVCTKHFQNGGPTAEQPDPLPATPSSQGHIQHTPARKPPMRRAYSEPLKKKRRVLVDVTRSENVPDTIPEDDRELKDENPERVSDSREGSCEIGVSALDMLALTAENQQLKEQVAKLILEKEEFQRNANLNTDKSNDKEVRHFAFSVKEVVDSHVKDSFKYYTGFSYEQFLNIFNFLVQGKDDIPFKYTQSVKSAREMPLQDQFLMTLMRLRLNFDNKYLAHLFLISPQDVSLIFNNWINYMYFQFGSVPIWPSREVIIENMPEKFKVDFPDTIVILDGTEMKTERPSSLTSQSKCYSDYKSSTTLKGLVGVDPRGSVIFASTLFSGSISDKEITGQSGLLDVLKQLLERDMLKPGDGVMVDKGFNIREEIGLGLKLIIPPNDPSEGQMPHSDVALTRRIAIHRVHVERAICRIKNFRILSDKIDLSLFASINQIWFVCCFLTNFMPLLIQDRSSVKR